MGGKEKRRDERLDMATADISVLCIFRMCNNVRTIIDHIHSQYHTIRLDEKYVSPDA